ncbi:MAG: hypothetical protein HY748_16450 [Elusimicrobia bacterium]|nr:hypothetical protein [Elusimicrobiota bacterium]
MRIERFWVVVKPGPVSELGDICFETDAKGLALQLKGGLDEGDIHALYTACEEAQKEAGRILAAFNLNDALFA